MFTIRPTLGGELVPSSKADRLILGAGQLGIAAARRLAPLPLARSPVCGGVAAHGRLSQLFFLPTIAQHYTAFPTPVIDSWQSWFNVHVTLGAPGVA